MKTKDNQKKQVEQLEVAIVDTSADNHKENELRINRQRMISLALFEAAMRFREGHYREDAEEYKNFITKESQPTIEASARGKRRAIEKRIEAIAEKNKNEMEAFNNAVYTYIDNVTGRMSGAMQVGFDNYSTAYGLLADELQKTSNATRMLTLVKMFNNGDFNEMFDKIDADRKKEEG